MGWECESCGRSFKSENAMGQHQQKTNDGLHTYLYSCGFCDRGFVSRPAADQHVRKSVMHWPFDEDWECKKCNLFYSSEHSLNQHRVNAVVHTHPYQCKSCNLRFRSEYARTVHQADHDLTWTCSECDRQYECWDSMMQHTEDAHILECTICYCSFNTSRARDRHIRDTHGRSARKPLSTYAFVKRGWGNFPNFCASMGFKWSGEGIAEANALARQMAAEARDEQ